MQRFVPNSPFPVPRPRDQFAAFGLGSAVGGSNLFRRM